jgi:hypothetical protein
MGVESKMSVLGWMGAYKLSNPIICVDFDGVIHSYTSGWQGVATIPDDPVFGAIEWLKAHLPCPDELCAMAPSYKGPIVQIYSSRSRSWRGRRAMKRWLIQHGLHPSYIREGILKFPRKKPPAFLTLDDRAICFRGTFPTTEEMMEFRPWYTAKINFFGKG